MSDNFLETVEPEEKATALGQVMAPIQRLIELRKTIAEKEDELSDLNAQERLLSREEIPAILLQHGLSSLDLANGLRVTIKEELDVSLPKNEEGRKIVLKWLSEKGGADLIKDSLTMTDPDQDIRDILADRGIIFEERKDVNTMSFKAWFRRALGMTKGSIASVAITDVPAEANLFLYKKTEIK